MTDNFLTQPTIPHSPVGDNIFLIEPSQHQPDTFDKADPHSNGPSLIVLCTWQGGATTPRVSKYVEGYRALFPRATVLLVRTVLADLTRRSFAAIRSRLQPARDIILQHLSSASPASLLLHIFSHGGCNTAIQLSRSVLETAMSFHDALRLIIFDCCPGDSSFTRAYRAAVLSIPTSPSILGKPILYPIGAAAILPVVATISALQSLSLIPAVEDMRRELNDPSLFGTRARRLYLFSRADVMVSPTDVVAHARDCDTQETGLVIFRTAPHCALLTEDAHRYWTAIRSAWAGQPLPQFQAGAKL